MDKCEYCGEEKDFVEATPFHGFYCADCLRMNIEFDRTALRKMPKPKRQKVDPEELERLKLEKDKALAKLMNIGK